MRRSLCTLRKSAVVIVALFSVALAVFLVFHLGTPGRIGQFSSLEILAVLALVVLPAATAAAWELDRRAGHRIAHEDEPEPARPDAERRLHDGRSGAEPVHRHRVTGRTRPPSPRAR